MKCKTKLKCFNKKDCKYSLGRRCSGKTFTEDLDKVYVNGKRNHVQIHPLVLSVLFVANSNSLSIQTGIERQ